MGHVSNPRYYSSGRGHQFFLTEGRINTLNDLVFPEKFIRLKETAREIAQASAQGPI